MPRAHADPVQQHRADAAPLPLVHHGHGHLGRIGAHRVTHEARDADTRVVGLVERDDRLVVVMVDVGQMPQGLLGERAIGLSNRR